MMASVVRMLLSEVLAGVEMAEMELVVFRRLMVEMADLVEVPLEMVKTERKVNQVNR